MVKDTIALLAVLALASCASTTTADVRRMGRDGDVDSLLGTWDDAKRDGLRIAVLDELAQHGEDARARDVVVRSATAHPSEPVRLAALRGLARLDGADVTPVLIRGLGDPWPSVRDLSRATLESKDAAIVEPLCAAALTDSNHLVRSSALRLLTTAALKWADHRARVETLLGDRARSDDAPKAREAAVNGLGQLQVQGARALLVELKKTDGDASVRIAAERAIGRLGATAAQNTVVVAVLPLKNDTGTSDAELERLGGQIREYVAARLSSANVCEVVDREKTDQAIAELKKIGKQIYDGDTPNAPEIGSFKLANQLVYGSVQKQGTQFTIVLNRMDVSTLQLVPGAAATVTGYRADIEQLKVEVTERFLARFR